MRKVLKFKHIKFSGQILASCLKLSKSLIKPNITTLEIDEKVKEFILSNDAVPSFLGYQGHNYSTCIAVNDEIVHGIPSNYKLKLGDVVTVDIGVSYKNHCTDAARTFVIGNTTEEIKNLVLSSYKSLNAGISKVCEGNKVGDISYEIQRELTMSKHHTLLMYGGHGIGTVPHTEPFIANYGKKGTGPDLVQGMCLAIEPILLLDDMGSYERKDGCIVSNSGCISSHVEDTVLVDNSPIILTRRTLDGDLV